MHKTRKDWTALIENPRVPQSFAGTEMRIPKAGEQVRVIRGQGLGKICLVVLVKGPVYSPVQRVYVDVPGEIPTWYFPWDVEVIPAIVKSVDQTP